MKKMRKGTWVCWIIGVFFLLSSFSFLPNGGYGEFACGVIIAAALGFVGFRMSNKPEKPTISDVSLASEFEHKTFKVSGVSFNNDDGTSRQSVLRKIKWNDPPFDKGAELELKKYEFEGKPAYGVYANNTQIGNIPADGVQFVADNWDRLLCFTAINVYGGGKTDEGEQKSFGAEVVLRFKK